MKPGTIAFWAVSLVGAYLVLAGPDWHAPVMGTQIGFRGTGSIQFAKPVDAASQTAAIPAELPAATGGGQKASAVYKNVQVLGDVDAAEFMRLQSAITQWVSPKQGCGFCHDQADYSADTKPAKLAARRMLEMTRYINAAWASHVRPSMVTCFTCHRGQPVPSEAWWPRYTQPERDVVARRDAWFEAADTVSGFFPDAGYAEYFLQDNPIAAQSTTALPSGTVADAVVVKRIYEMMMQMSLQIGVNCGFCHNSRAIEDWSQSSPERWIGFYALRMIRDLNRNYLLPLADLIPQQRRLIGENALPAIPEHQMGEQPGNALLTCGTCHHGLPRPLQGANLGASYGELIGAAPPSPDVDPATIESVAAALKASPRPRSPIGENSGVVQGGAAP